VSKHRQYVQQGHTKSLEKPNVCSVLRVTSVLKGLQHHQSAYKELTRSKELLNVRYVLQAHFVWKVRFNLKYVQVAHILWNKLLFVLLVLQGFTVHTIQQLKSGAKMDTIRRQERLNVLIALQDTIVLLNLRRLASVPEAPIVFKAKQFVLNVQKVFIVLILKKNHQLFVQMVLIALLALMSVFNVLLGIFAMLVPHFRPSVGLGSTRLLGQASAKSVQQVVFASKVVSLQQYAHPASTVLKARVFVKLAMRATFAKKVVFNQHNALVEATPQSLKALNANNAQLAATAQSNLLLPFCAWPALTVRQVNPFAYSVLRVPIAK
jgi:hypothetical protein